MSIHSSLFNTLSVCVGCGRGGSSGLASARVFSLRSSAEGIPAARGCAPTSVEQRSREGGATYDFAVHVDVLLDPHICVVCVIVYNVQFTA